MWKTLVDLKPCLRVLRCLVTAAVVLMAAGSLPLARAEQREQIAVFAAGADTKRSEPPSPRNNRSEPALIPAFRPTTREDVAAARRELQHAVRRLSQLLDRSGERGDAWRMYLLCAELREQLESDAPDVRVLEAVLARFAADHRGLERAPCCEVRRALRAYIRALRDAQDEGLPAAYAARIETLLHDMNDRRLDDEPRRREAVSDDLAWLVAHDQAASLTREMRRRYSAPNLSVEISEAFVNRALARQIEEAMPIRQTQGRTAVRGTALVQGGVRAVLVDNAERAEIDVVFVGNMFATMTGNRGSVSVGVRGNADVAARKRLRLTDVGIGAWPAESDVALRTRLTGASTRFRFRLLDRAVSRLALRVAEREKRAADAQAQREAMRLLNARFDEEVRKLAADVQRQYLDLYRNPLIRRDAFPEQFSVTTSKGRLRLSLVQATEDQLGAPSEAPEIADKGDVAVRLHESLVDNLAETFFGGRTLTESDLRAELAKLTGGDHQAATSAAAEVDEVAITFPQRRPFTLRVSGGVVAVTLRGARYISRSRAYPPMNVTVRFRLEHVRDGYVAELIGEPEIVPPRFADQDSPRRYSGREAALRRLLVNRLDKHLKKRVESEQLELPQSLGNVTELSVRRLHADGGWLTAALSLPGHAAEKRRARITSAEPVNR